MKSRVTFYLSDKLVERLALAAGRPGANKSAIVETALNRFLIRDGEATGEAVILQRLDRLARQIDRLDRDLAIILETLSLHIRYYLCVTPPVRGSDKDVYRALGRRRFDSFVKQVGRRLNSGGKFVGQVMEQLGNHGPDLFLTKINDRADGQTPVAANNSDSRARDAAGEQPGLSPAGREEGGHV